MKKAHKILISIFSLMILFSLLNVSSVAAQTTPDEINQDTYQARLNAHEQYNFRFRLRTQLRIMANVNIDININCEPMKIGVKDFALEVTTDHDLKMNMTCTEEQAELGLLNGYTYQIRNRNGLRYEEGFCVGIETNGTQIQAKLMIQATNQNQLGTWPTMMKQLRNGYLFQQ